MAMKKLFALACMGKLAIASWSSIAGFAPSSKVTDHNAIDLDQKAVELLLSEATIDYPQVKKIYSEGGNSKSYALFAVNALTAALSKGDKVVQGGVEGKMYENAAINAVSIKVAYKTSETQATYVMCKEGALKTAPAGTTPASNLPFKFTTGCFTNGQLTVTSSGVNVAVDPTGQPTNTAGRTLQKFSTKAGGLMFEKGPNGGCKDASDRATDGCPYAEFTKYKNYYGDSNYADKLVSAAIDKGPTGFTSKGNMDFTGTSDQLRKEVIKKGTAYMNVYMYAIREFEDAIDDCKAGCLNGMFGSDPAKDCNGLSTASAHAWDEGVAFYTGSLEGGTAGGNTDGVFPYRLAEKRCKNFKTCGPQHDAVTGISYVNLQLFNKLAIGSGMLLKGQCNDVAPILRDMEALMAIPLIQGTLRYAYKVDRMSGGDKEKGEGAIFAAAIVPRVHACNSADGDTIMNNMKVGASSTSYTAVKTAFEKNYPCMKITCEQVGGLWVTASNKYEPDAGPCSVANPAGQTTQTEEKETLPGWAIGVIVAIGVLLLCFAVGCCLIVYREKTSGRATFGTLQEQQGIGKPANDA